MKYALVTGGSRGIGRACCLELCKMGYPVLINYNSNIAAANATLEQVKSLGGSGDVLQFDVADRAQTANALEGWLAKNEGVVIEVIINNAGIRKDKALKPRGVA